MTGTGKLIRAALALAIVSSANLAGGQATTLTGGRLASYKDLDGTDIDRATFKFLRDPLIAAPLEDPTCPAADSLLTLRDDDQQISYVLPCANWAPSGKGYKYSDRTGAIRLVLYSEGRLIVKAKGDAYGAAPLVGPTTFAEADLVVGAAHFCGRFPGPGADTKRNDPDRVAFGGPSTDCVLPTPTATITPTPPPFPPTPCTTGDDPLSGADWVVCQADASTAWVSSNVVGQYRADLICLLLGYSVVTQYGGTAANVCGVMGDSGTSCSSPGTRTFNCSGYQGSGPLLGNTVHWECGMTAPPTPICP